MCVVRAPPTTARRRPRRLRTWPGLLRGEARAHCRHQHSLRPLQLPAPVPLLEESEHSLCAPSVNAEATTAVGALTLSWPLHLGKGWIARAVVVFLFAQARIDLIMRSPHPQHGVAARAYAIKVAPLGHCGKVRCARLAFEEVLHVPANCTRPVRTPRIKSDARRKRVKQQPHATLRDRGSPRGGRVASCGQRRSSQASPIGIGMYASCFSS